MRSTSPTHRTSKPNARPAVVTAPTRRGRRDYEDLDLDDEEEEQQASNGTKHAVPASVPENYSRLDREVSPLRKISPPDKSKVGGKPQIPNRPLGSAPRPSRPHVPPAGPSTDEKPAEVPDGLYAAVQKPKKRAAATVHSKRPLPPTTIPKPSLSGSNPDLSGIGDEEYGKLIHNIPALPPRPPELDEYNTLDLVTSKTNGNVPKHEEYGKLERGGSGGRSAGGPSLPTTTTPAHIADQYDTIDLTSTSTSVPPSAHYEMPDLPQPSLSAAAIPPQEEYGKLRHNVSANSVPAVQPEEYGRLERPMATKTSVPSTPEDEYGHLETRPRTSSFNPYGTLANSTEVGVQGMNGGIGNGSGASPDPQLAPPPGYENTEIKPPSLAYRMSVTSNQLSSRPQAPPRGQNTSPSLQKKAIGQSSGSDKGPGRKTSPPLPPYRPQTDNSSHDPTLKSGAPNGVVAFSKRPKVSSFDYEDTEKLDFGLKPGPSNGSTRPFGLQKSVSTGSTTSEIPPPPAPRRGASVRKPASTSKVTLESPTNNNKPSVAPKPPKVKPKPVVN